MTTETVKLTWKRRVTKKSRAAIVKKLARFKGVDCGEYATILTRPTKAFWVFLMLSKSFDKIETL